MVKDTLANSPKSRSHLPGAPRYDDGDKSWQDVFCAKLYEYNGNREKASKHTPYSFHTVIAMLTPSSESFDEPFRKMVDTTIARIAAEVEEKYLSLRDDANFADFDLAKVTETRARYYDKLLEKLDRERYGRNQNINVNAKVDHQHTVQIEPSERLAMLFEDQKRYFESRNSTTLALPPKAEEAVMEAELVDEDEDELDEE